MMRRRAFSFQKSCAKQRGISFIFTFEEWLNWWEMQLGPNWFELRGKHKHQYVMARNGDKGPYHPDNVKCITVSANLKEVSRKGVKNSRAILTEKEVEVIYLTKESQFKLARQYNVTKGCIRDIKHKRNWVHITAKLDAPSS